MVRLDLNAMAKKLSVLVIFSFLVLLSFFGHLGQGQASNDLGGKLNINVLTDRTQITPDESLSLLVQVTNVGEVNVTDIYLNLTLPAGFESNQTSPIHLKNLTRNETGITIFSITALQNVTPDNYSLWVFVNSTNTSTIVATAPITFTPTSYFDRLMLSYPYLRPLSNPILQTLIIATILGGLASAIITSYFNNKAKDKETYIASLEAVKDLVFMHYLPMAGSAKRFARRLKSACKNKNELNIKHSFYLLAVFFSLRSRFQREKGGVLRLQSFKNERISQKIRHEAMDLLSDIITVDEISKTQKYVSYDTHFIDFTLKLSQEIDLMNIYNKFHNWINNPENDKKINSIIRSFHCYGEYMEYQTTLMFSAWYKREGLERIKFWEPIAKLHDDCKSYIETELGESSLE